MKKIFGITGILLLWAGFANAGALKVIVPVDQFEQMESRLETLEKENSQLKAGIIPYTAKTSEAEDALVKENDQLKEQIKSLAEKSSKTNEVSANKKIQTQIDALERENNQLQEQVKSLAEKTPVTDTTYSSEINSRLDALGKENRQLKRTVASLNEKRLLVGGDNRTARHEFFKTNKKFASHTFK